MPIHGLIIILFLSEPLNLETVERKGKKLQKAEYFANKNSFLHEIKSIFHSF